MKYDTFTIVNMFRWVFSVCVLIMITVRAFRTWITAEGVVNEAAIQCGESRFAFHRQWDRRKAEFRAACDWVEADVL